MPRNIKNDTPSAAQLSDLIRPIVKSEIRRRDGAMTTSLEGAAGAGLGWNTTTYSLDVNLLSTGGLQFTGDSIGIKPDPAGPFSVSIAGLGSPFFAVSGGGTNLTATASNNLSFFAVNGVMTFTSINSDITLDASAGGMSLICGGILINALTGNIDIYCDSSNITLSAAGAVSVDGSTVALAPSGGGIGLFGATPISRPGTYTLTAAPAVNTDLDADANSGPYTSNPVYGSADGDIITSNGATLADLNDLRSDVESLSGLVRQLIKHLGDTSGLGAVDETGY